MRDKMKRTLPNIAAVLVVIPVALVLFAAKLTSGASRSEAGAVVTPAVPEQLAATAGETTPVFPGGGFWGVEAVFDHVKGVKRATSGYAGGDVASPSYEQVSSYDVASPSYEQVSS